MMSKKVLFHYLLVSFILIFIGCGGGGGSSSLPSSSSTSGTAQKGPFKIYSIVRAYKLVNGQRSQTDIVTSHTKDDLGHFSMTIPWSGATEFEITGSYLNENTGKTVADGNLTAIVDVQAGQTTENININIFTHIEAQRVKELLKQNSSIQAAKADAQQKLQNIFGISTDPTKLDLTDGSGEHKADNTQLLLVSSTILNSENPEKLLKDITDDLKDGSLDDKGEGAVEKIKKDANSTLLQKAHDNLKIILDIPTPPAAQSREGELLLNHNIKFEPKFDVEVNSDITSDEVVVSSLTGTANVRVENATLLVNSQTGKTTVTNGDRIQLIQKSASTYDTAKISTLYIGSTPITFKTTTKADPNKNDTTPNAFKIPVKYDVQPAKTISSDEIIVSGLSEGVGVDINVSEGSYSINDVNQTGTSTVYNQDRVRVYLTSSPNATGEKSSVLNIGGVTGVFKVFTKDLDRTPDYFEVPSKYNVDPQSIYITDYVTLGGFEGELTLKVINGYFQIEGYDTWETYRSNISSGLRVRFKQYAASFNNSKTTTVIKLGNMQTSFFTITKAADTTISTKPNPISFTAITGADFDQDYISNEQTISGISSDYNTTIKVSNGFISVNSGSWVTSAVVKSGDTVRVKVHTQNDENTLYKAILTYTDKGHIYTYTSFKVYTKAKDTIPDDIVFNDVTDAPLSSEVVSNEVIISGIDAMVNAKITAYYSLNGSDWQAPSSINLTNGDKIKLKLDTSSNQGETKTAAVIFEDTSYFWRVTTNIAPRFRNRPDFQSINPGDSISFQIDVYDENTPITYSLENAPSWLQIDANTGIISGTASGLARGIKLVATDSKGLSSYILFDINANQAPELFSKDFKKEFIVDDNSSMPNQYNLNFTISDTDTPVSMLTTSIKHEIIQERVPATAIDKGFTESQIICDLQGNCVAQIKLDFSRNDGLHPSLKTRHYITVSDGDKNTTDYIDIWFAPIAPYLDGSKIQEVEFTNSSETAYKTYSFTPSNTGNKAESWSIQNKPAWAVFDSTTGTLSGTPALDQNGTYENIAITATNDRGSDTFTFNIVVKDKTPPKKFDFKDLNGVEINHRYESSIKVDWLADGEKANISISGYEANPNNTGFSVNGASSTTVQNGDIVTVWHISANTPDTTLKTVVTIGNDSDEFITTTKASETTKLPLIVGSPTTEAHLHEKYSYIPALSTDYNHFAPANRFEIVNKPDWADFNSSNGELSGTPTSLGVYKRVKIIAYSDEGLDDIDFDITVTSNPPYLQPEQNPSLDNEDITITFNDNPDWRSKINKVTYEGCYGSESVELSSNDYTFSEGVLKLHVATTDKALLRTPSMSMSRVIVSADGYPDTEADIYGISDGQYAVKIVLYANSANSDLNESNLNGAKVDLYLQNTLKFKDSQLDINNFSIAEVTNDSGDLIGVEGVTIQNVEYLTPTTATVTLAFNGYDFDEFKQLSIAIAPDELNICEEIKSKNLPIPPVLEKPRKAMLYGSDETNNTNFGSAVSIEGDLAAVGSNTNKVYIFQEDSNKSYFEVDKITLPDEAYGHVHSLSLSGNYLVVSKNDANQTGRVYLYVSDFGHQYNLKYDLTPQSGLSNYGNFGAKVVMKNNLIAIAYGGTTSENAKIYLYELDSNGDIAAQSTISLQGTNLSTLIEEFGLDMIYDSYDDSYIIVAGSKNGSNQNGVVDIYKYQNHSASYVASLYAPNADQSVADRFGQSIAIDKNYIAVSAPNKNDIYIYKVYSPTSISLIKTIHNQTQGFGLNIDLDSDFRLKVVASTLANRAYSYIFDKYDQNYQTHESMLVDGDHFGERVAINKENVIYSILSNEDKGTQSGAALISYVWDDVSTGIDTTPYQFTFNDVTNAELNTDYEDDIVVIGINAPAPLSITGGKYSIDGGSSWSTQPTSVIQNQQIYVKLTSASEYATTTSLTLTIGGVSDTFSVTTKTNTNTPTFTLSDNNVSLDNDFISFNFGSNPDWQSKITQVKYKAGSDAQYVILSSSDYTIEDGVFKLNIASSSNPCLHLAYQNGGEIVISASGYSDVVISISQVLGGEHEAKATISTSIPLEENSLDNAVLNLTLTNTLLFRDTSLDKSNFRLVKAPDGVSIYSVDYQDATHATITLAYDNTDFDALKQLQISISKDELNTCRDILTNEININPSIDTYYDDINATVNYHKENSIGLGIDSHNSISIFSPATDGNTSFYLIGNEIWSMDYNHTGCNMNDRVIYQTEDGKGIVNIKVIRDTDIPKDINISLKAGGRLYEYELFDDTNITSVTVSQAQNGVASVVQKDGKYLLNYQPDENFLGEEDLSISVNKVDGTCNYTENINVKINVYLLTEYTAFSFYNDQNSCSVFVSDGSIVGTKDINLTINTGKCNENNISGDYKRIKDSFVFEKGVNYLYRLYAPTGETTLLNSSGEFTMPILDNSLYAKATFTYTSLVGSSYYTLERLVFGAYRPAESSSDEEGSEENNAGSGTLPWSIDARGSMLLVDDFIAGVGGDKTISNYIQEYQVIYDYFDQYYTKKGNHLLYVGYDGSGNGNGQYLNKGCIFKGLQNCEDGFNLALYEVNQTEGLKESDSFSIAVNRFNNIFYFDNTNHNLWITLDIDMTYSGNKDKTKLITDSGYSYMDLKANDSADRVYFQAITDNGDRVIGYFYRYVGMPFFNNLLVSCMSSSDSQGCTITLEHYYIGTIFNDIMKKTLINLGNSSQGEWLMVGDKIYITQEDADGNSDIFEVTNGSKVAITGLEANNIAKVKAMKEIDGYIYILGENADEKNVLLMLDPKDNTVTTIVQGWYRNVTLYDNSVYKNDYNFYKIFYTTKEDDGNGDYLYSLYGYNPYKKESVLIKTQTIPAP